MSGRLLLMLGSTYTRELDTAVTALGGGTPLLDVKVPVLATGGPDNADLVGDRVVPEHACVSLRVSFPSSWLIVVPGISRFECAFCDECFRAVETHGWRRL
jgi:hypothetical protein